MCALGSNEGDRVEHDMQPVVIAYGCERSGGHHVICGDLLGDKRGKQEAADMLTSHVPADASHRTQLETSEVHRWSPANGLNQIVVDMDSE